MMRGKRFFEAIGTFAVLLLALTLSADPGRAASTVEITYDLSDTDLVWEGRLGPNSTPFIVSNADDSFGAFNEIQAPGIVSGSMKVRYVSNSSSGMPIEHGAATLLTFNLTVQSWELPYPGGTFIPYLVSGTLHWQLTAPAAGNFASIGALTGVNAHLLMTGRANCGLPSTPYGSYYCQNWLGLPPFTIYPNYHRTGPISATGSAGPYGGAQSTPHTVTGRGRAVGWVPGLALFGLGYEHQPYDDIGGVYLTGREVLREAEGHDPKVIPEPGTLLLLGAGTAGLALVSSATRRVRQG